MKPGKDYIGVGCGVFLNNDKGETLFALRSKKSKNEVGLWNKVGGAVEFGEKVEEALAREALEEIGVEICDIEFLSITDHILPGENQHWIAINYMGKIKSGQTPKIMEPEKHDEIRWFKFDQVPANLAMPTAESLSLMIEKYNQKYQN